MILIGYRELESFRLFELIAVMLPATVFGNGRKIQKFLIIRLRKLRLPNVLNTTMFIRNISVTDFNFSYALYNATRIDI